MTVSNRLDWRPHIADTRAAPATVEQLQQAVHHRDALSQEGFSQISAIAGLALAVQETPEGHLHPDTVARPLQAIRDKANEIENVVNNTAFDVGCSYVDTGAIRRTQAMNAAWGPRSKATPQQATQTEGAAA